MLAQRAEIRITDLCAGAAGGVKLVHMHRVSSHRSFYCVRRLSVRLANSTAYSACPVWPDWNWDSSPARDRWSEGYRRSPSAHLKSTLHDIPKQLRFLLCGQCPTRWLWNGRIECGCVRLNPIIDRIHRRSHIRFDDGDSRPRAGHILRKLLHHRHSIVVAQYGHTSLSCTTGAHPPCEQTPVCESPLRIIVYAIGFVSFLMM